MRLKPEELRDQNYVLLDKMDHLELIPFVKKYLKKNTVSALFYYLSNIVFLGLLLFSIFKYFRSGNFIAGTAIFHFSIGMIIAFALIPVHEFIHVLAYKSQGARQTSYDVNLRKFYFLAIADKFVADQREFKIVALSPYITITLAGVALLLLVGQVWSITLLTTLLTHGSFCSGDFALLSYFELNSNMEIVTYDDKENKISYFYAKEKPRSI